VEAHVVRTTLLLFLIFISGKNIKQKLCRNKHNQK